MIVAIIPAPFYADEKSVADYTRLRVNSVCGYESIVHPDKLSVLVRGLVCVLNCGLDELRKEHPNTFYSTNPLQNIWRHV